MKTNLFDIGKRKFIFGSSLALASLKLFNPKSQAQAATKEKETASKSHH